MSENETLAIIFESLLEQTRAVRDLKIESESLKQMLFAYRPAYLPAFDQQMKKVSATPQVQQLNLLMDRLGEAVRALKHS